MGRFSAVLLWAERSRRPSGYIGCSCMGGAEPRPYEVNLVIPRGRGFPVYIRRSNPAPVGVRLALL